MVKYPSYDCWGPTIRHEVGKSVWIFRFSSRFFLSWKLLVPDPWGHHRRHQGYMPWACLKVELPKILPCFIISHDIPMISPFSWVLLHPHTPTELGWLDHVISHRFWGKNPSVPGSLGRAHLLALIVGLVSMKVPPVWDPRTGRAAVVVSITLQLNPDIDMESPQFMGQFLGKPWFFRCFHDFSTSTESLYAFICPIPRLWAVPCGQVQRFEAGGIVDSNGWLFFLTVLRPQFFYVFLMICLKFVASKLSRSPIITTGLQYYWVASVASHC